MTLRSAAAWSATDEDGVNSQGSDERGSDVLAVMESSGGVDVLEEDRRTCLGQVERTGVRLSRVS